MNIDIVAVQRTPDRDSYTVVGQVGTRRESVEVSALELEQALVDIGAKRTRLEYNQADLVPFVAIMATPELAAAFSL